MSNKILEFYSRKDVQKEIARVCSNREVAVNFGGESYGKRPDTIQFENDIYELALQGATSFHISEEHWKNPMMLETGMTKRQLDEIRAGWDLLIDIDCKFVDYSKEAAILVIEALKFHGVEKIAIKFSGNRGFHIIVPFSSFPDVINDKNTALMFPEYPRTIVAYIKHMIKDPLAKKILTLTKTDDLAMSLKKSKETLMENGAFNPYSVLELDPILISSRHLFRAPYSINEKSGLVSIPIKPDELQNFSPSTAKIENISKVESFADFPESNKRDAAMLLIKALDWEVFSRKKEFGEEKAKRQNATQSMQKKIDRDLFPPCMRLALQGMKEDGRKRAIFVMVNFLKHVGYGFEDIEKMLKEWNEKNYEPLRPAYIASQISWFKKQKENILPPNCINEAYYVSMGICKPDNFCKKIKNPVNYAVLKSRMRMRQEQMERGAKSKSKMQRSR